MDEGDLSVDQWNGDRIVGAGEAPGGREDLM
jgi:hypothetical protein